MAAAPPPLAPDLVDGLRRLKLATMRDQAAEVLQSAKTQRWGAEDVLRTLLQGGDRRARRGQSSHPTQTGRLSGAPRRWRSSTWPNHPSLAPPLSTSRRSKWVDAKENLLLVGPSGTGKSHALVGCGVRAVERGKKVRYLVAADLIETLYRGLADNTVGKVISGLLRNELMLIDELGFAPLDDTGSQLLFRFVAAAYERRSLGVASHWPFEEWGHFLPVQTTAVSLLDASCITRSWWSRLVTHGG